MQPEKESRQLHPRARKPLSATLTLKCFTVRNGVEKPTSFGRSTSVPAVLLRVGPVMLQLHVGFMITDNFPGGCFELLVKPLAASTTPHRLWKGQAESFLGSGLLRGLVIVMLWENAFVLKKRQASLQTLMTLAKLSVMSPCVLQPLVVMADTEPAIGPHVRLSYHRKNGNNAAAALSCPPRLR